MQMRWRAEMKECTERASCKRNWNHCRRKCRDNKWIKGIKGEKKDLERQKDH